MPDINTQELQDSIDALASALSAAAGITGQMSQATGQAAQQTAAAVPVTREQIAQQRRAAQAAASAADAMGKMTNSMFDMTKAMYDGKKGATAFNGALDTMASAAGAAGNALGMLGGPVVKALAAGMVFLTKMVVGTAKAALEMNDALSKGYQDLSRSGAAASDGMTGVFRDLQKLGMGFQELESFTRLVGENSRELANFRGSVFAGRREFANIADSMEQYRAGLINAGLTQEQINEETLVYISLQTRLGRSQSATVSQLAEGARNYLMEQDALTKLTGVQRKEIEDQQRSALAEEQFRAKIRQLQLSGQGEAADRLLKYNRLMTAINPELGKGVRALATGNLRAEEARRLLITSGGQAARDLRGVIEGTTPLGDAADNTARAIGRFSDTIGVNLGVLQANNTAFMDLAAQQDIRIAQEKGFAETLTKIEADQVKQGVENGQAQDKLVQTQTDTILNQQKSMLALQRELFDNVVPVATSAMKSLTDVVNDLTLGFQKLLSFIPGMGPKTTEQRQASFEVNQAEAKLQAQKRDMIESERALLAAKKTGNREEIAAAEKTLEAAKVSKKQAEGKLLDAEVQKKYADDRATGRTGAGIGGQQLRADGSMISPSDYDYVPPAPAAGPGPSAAPGNVTEKLLDYIGKIESRGNYNVLVGGKTKTGLTDMTIAQVLEFQKTMRRMGHESTAVGKYQIIQKTLEGLVSQGAAKLDDKFSPAVQDRLAVALMRGRGLEKYQRGQITAAQFADKLAQEWASLPTASGRSAHHGVGSNKALSGRDDFMKVFAEKGGVFTGPKSGYDAILHGSEAVVPLPDGKTIPVSMNQTTGAAADNSELLQVMREVKSSIESMTNRSDNQRVVSVIEDSIRTQRTSNDILQKILQMSQ